MRFLLQAEHESEETYVVPEITEVDEEIRRVNSGSGCASEVRVLAAIVDRSMEDLEVLEENPIHSQDFNERQLSFCFFCSSF